MNDLKKLIREVPDWPKPGILFYDLTTLLKNRDGFRALIDALCEHYADKHVDVVAGIEARGFIFAPALAYPSARASFPSANRKSFPGKRRRSPTRSNTARTRSKSIRTPSSQASGC